MSLIKQLLQAFVLYFLLKVDKEWDERIAAKQKRVAQLKSDYEKLRAGSTESDNRRANELFDALRTETRGLANLRALYASATARGADLDKVGGVSPDEGRKLVSGKKSEGA